MVTFEQAKEAWEAYSARAERIENAARFLAEALCDHSGEPFYSLNLQSGERHMLLALRREFGLPVNDDRNGSK